jgi:UDP-N-acetylglucosamine 2-epimerase
MKNKIMTFEPIHGFAISKKDPIYGTKSKYNFPDVFLTFDDQSFKTLSCNKFSTAKIIQCQHPFRQRQVYFGKQKNKKQNLLNKNKKRYIILYTLQHGYDGSRDYLTKISNNGLIYNEVVETLKKIKDAFIIIKGHPVQLHSDAWPRLQKTLNELFSGVKNVDCKNYHFFDISYLLKCADLHITMSSGTITEAALFNVPSIGLCPTLRKGKIFGEAFISEKESAMLETTEINKNKILKLVTKKLKKRKSKNYIFEKKPLMGNVILNLSAKKL